MTKSSETPLRANERQVGGEHYKKRSQLQHWDLVAIYGWDYFQAQIIKYVMRWRDKAGVVDLHKAAHVIEKYIELEELRAKGMLTRELLSAALVAIEEDDSMAEHGASRREPPSYPAS